MNAFTATILDTSAPIAVGDADESFVTLTVAGQLCGVPVLSVRDILGAQIITRIPLAPPEIAGSLNLRGRIVTAIDLRRRLGLPCADARSLRMSVVAEQGGELYALLVDQVSEVMRLLASAFERNPSTLGRSWAAFSAGIYRLEDRLMVVLDVARLLALSRNDEAVMMDVPIPNGTPIAVRTASAWWSMTAAWYARWHAASSKRSGFSVEEAEDGSLALEACRRQMPRLRAAGLEHAGDERHRIPQGAAPRVRAGQSAGACSAPPKTTSRSSNRRSRSARRNSS